MRPGRGLERLLAGGAALLVLATVACTSSRHSTARRSPGPLPTATSTSTGPASPGPAQSPARPARPNGPLAFTYYYYWYDAATNAHLGPNQPLPLHPPPTPTPSWHNVEWHKKQLSDMAAAGIDVVLPVYWGYGRESWSTEGLGYLVQARHQLLAAGRQAPPIGLFFDTTPMAGLDLTNPADMETFYSNVRDFYQRIPRGDWALVSGRPVVWLYVPQNGNRFGQPFFDHLYSRFTEDFGVRPFIVREAGWYCAITAWASGGPSARDCSHPISTDGMYHWGGAYDGYKDVGNVAEVGPEYDERQVPGRRGLVRPPDGGVWYATNMQLAVASKKRLLAIETWNEYHEATAIGETVEYGRSFIDATRQYLDIYHASN